MAKRRRFYEDPRALLVVAGVVTLLALACWLDARAAGPAAGGRRQGAYAQEEFPTPTTEVTPTPSPLPTIGYPAARDALTDLQPVYVPFVRPAPGWTPRVRTSYDRSAGNWDSFPTPTATATAFCIPEGAPPLPSPTPLSTPDAGPPPTVVWFDVPSGSGIVTHIFMAQPLPLLGGDANAQIQFFSPPNATEPVATLSLADLEQAGDYPLAANSRYSSGGNVLYRPFGFNSGLRIVSVGAGQAYFHVSYEQVPVSVTPGWIDPGAVNGLAQRWRPEDMGKTADLLSPTDAPAYRGVQTPTPATLTLQQGIPVTLFHDEGAGTVVKVAFPAAGAPAPVGQSPFDGIILTVRYSETEAASVTLPLGLVFLSPQADYTPDRPPTEGIDALAFGPDGKLIVVQGDTAWVLEPWNAEPRPGVLAGVWYRVSLGQWLGETGGVPTSDVDSYGLRSLLGSGGQALDQGTTVIQGTGHWYKQFLTWFGQVVPWQESSLYAEWGEDINPPPTDEIYVQAFSFDQNLSSALDHWVIAADQSWKSRLPRENPRGWQPGALCARWSFYCPPAPTPTPGPVDAYALTPLGYIVVSGDRFWSCSAGEDCNTGVAPWTGPTTLTDAAWIERAVTPAYAGALFFGYDHRQTPDPGDDEYYLTLPMPYERGITIALLSGRQGEVSVQARVEHTAQTYGDGRGHLDIAYVEGDGDSGVYMGGWPNPLLVATLRRRGKLVGLVRLARGQVAHCWGRTFLEADEVIVADNEAATLCSQEGGRWSCSCEEQPTFVECGTGMEDFSNSGWYFIQGPVYLPLSGAHRSMPNRLALPPLAPTVGPTSTPAPVPTCGPSPTPTAGPTPMPGLCGPFSSAYPYKYLGENYEPGDTAERDADVPFLPERRHPVQQLAADRGGVRDLPDGEGRHPLGGHGELWRGQGNHAGAAAHRLRGPGGPGGAGDDHEPAALFPEPQPLWGLLARDGRRRVGAHQLRRPGS